MKNKETSLKRMTFQGVINTQQQKLPQKSRSKSRNRSKASSISKGNISMTNRSMAQAYKTNKVQSKSSKKIQDNDNIASKTANQSIFRSSKRNTEQEIMKKIIKLKNQAIQLENSMKQIEANRSQSQIPQSFDNKQNERDMNRLEEIQNFLQEFDTQVRKQSKQIGQFYLKQIEEIDTQSQRKEFEIAQFKPLIVPHIAPSMPSLQAKLKQMQNSLSK